MKRFIWSVNGLESQRTNFFIICKKAKWLSEEALQIAVRRREVKKQRRKRKIYPFECRVPKNRKERKKNLPQ